MPTPPTDYPAVCNYLDTGVNMEIYNNTDIFTFQMNITLSQLVSWTISVLVEERKTIKYNSANKVLTPILILVLLMNWSQSPPPHNPTLSPSPAITGHGLLILTVVLLLTLTMKQNLDAKTLSLSAMSR